MFLYIGRKDGWQHRIFFVVVAKESIRIKLLILGGLLV